MNQQNKALLLALTAVTFWATASSAFKLTLEGHLTPAELLFYSLPVAILVVGIVLTLQRQWAAVARTTRREFARSALAGFVNPFLFYLVILNGYDMLPAQTAMTINFAWPIVLVVLSALFLKQRMTLKTILALLLGFAGVYVIGTEGSVFSMRFGNLTGVLLVATSTVVWSTFWILNMKDPREPAVKLFLNFLVGYGCMVLYWAILVERRIPPWQGLLGAAYVGVFEMGATFFLWLLALSYARRTADVANLIFLTPFLALLCIYLTVGETIFPATVWGLVLIIGGIVVQRTSSSA